MKITAFYLLTALALAVPASAADQSHKHDKKNAGPNGGRVITAVEPHLELFVTKDRKVEITALTEDLQPAKLSGQVITVFAGDRSKPTKMEFEAEGGKLVSTNALPEGNDFPLSMSVKADAEAKPIYEKFNLNLAKCPTCEHAEYACVCEHVGDSHSH